LRASGRCMVSTRSVPEASSWTSTSSGVCTGGLLAGWDARERSRDGDRFFGLTPGRR
jgi:hypothetical protein